MAARKQKSPAEQEAPKAAEPATVAVEIMNRWSGAVLFTAQVAASIGEMFRIKAAVEIAIGSDANLSGANLSDANLSGANLSGAYLRGANLRGANLSGAYLSGAYLRGANLRGAYLSGAYLSDADLRGAYLRGADLRGANLRGANLRGAYLSGAYLSGANLSGANLSGAKGLTPERVTPLLMLLDQPGPIRAYKLVNAAMQGPFNGGITYAHGGSYEELRANTDATEHCAAGLNVATLDWCMKEWREGYRILVVEFTAADIAAIPTGTDGKFRLRRMSVVGEKDLVALGLVKAPDQSAPLAA